MADGLDVGGGHVVACLTGTFAQAEVESLCLIDGGISMEKNMTEQEWLACTNLPNFMMGCLDDRPSERQSRLFACAMSG